MTFTEAWHLYRSIDKSKQPLLALRGDVYEVVILNQN